MDIIDFIRRISPFSSHCILLAALPDVLHDVSFPLRYGRAFTFSRLHAPNAVRALVSGMLWVLKHGTSRFFFLNFTLIPFLSRQLKLWQGFTSYIINSQILLQPSLSSSLSCLWWFLQGYNLWQILPWFSPVHPKCFLLLLSSLLLFRLYWDLGFCHSFSMSFQHQQCQWYQVRCYQFRHSRFQHS